MKTTPCPLLARLASFGQGKEGVYPISDIYVGEGLSTLSYQQAGLPGQPGIGLTGKKSDRPRPRGFIINIA